MSGLPSFFQHKGKTVLDQLDDFEIGGTLDDEDDDEIIDDSAFTDGYGDSEVELPSFFQPATSINRQQNADNSSPIQNGVLPTKSDANLDDLIDSFTQPLPLSLSHGVTMIPDRVAEFNTNRAPMPMPMPMPMQYHHQQMHQPLYPTHYIGPDPGLMGPGQGQINITPQFYPHPLSHSHPHSHPLPPGYHLQSLPMGLPMGAMPPHFQQLPPPLQHLHLQQQQHMQQMQQQQLQQQQQQQPQVQNIPQNIPPRVSGPPSADPRLIHETRPIPPPGPPPGPPPARQGLGPGVNTESNNVFISPSPQEKGQEMLQQMLQQLQQPLTQHPTQQQQLQQLQQQQQQQQQQQFIRHGVDPRDPNFININTNRNPVNGGNGQLFQQMAVTTAGANSLSPSETPTNNYPKSEMMTSSDVRFVVNKVVQPLETNDPYSEDYYFLQVN